MSLELQSYCIVIFGLLTSAYHAEKADVGIIGWSLICSLHFLFISIVLSAVLPLN